MRISFVGPAVVGALFTLAPAVAGAADIPRSTTEPPKGPGTEASAAAARPVIVREGWEANAGIGTGFADTYGLGFEGRVGYTFLRGAYVGGAVQYFIGHSVNDMNASAAFVGGEVGYKFFPSHRVEIRPYAFVGPAWITQVSAAPLESNSKVDLAIQPGLLAGYHFGDVYVGGDAHYMLFPTPNTLAVMATAGIGL